MSVVQSKPKSANAARSTALKTQFEASITAAERSPKVGRSPEVAAAVRSLSHRLTGPLDSLTTDLRMDLKGVASALFALGTTMEEHEPMDADLVHWCCRVIQQKVDFIDGVSAQCRSAINSALEERV